MWNKERLALVISLLVSSLERRSSVFESSIETLAPAHNLAFMSSC